MSFCLSKSRDISEVLVFSNRDSWLNFLTVFFSVFRVYHSFTITAGVSKCSQNCVLSKTYVESFHCVVLVRFYCFFFDYSFF